MTRDIQPTAIVVLTAIFLGLIVVLLHSDREYAFFAFIWSLACLAAGGGLGFLFGIPRILSDQAPAEPISVETTTSGNASTFDKTLNGQRRKSNYRPNTNLDKISDWLTTLIVGITLVQWREVVASFYAASSFIASGLGNNTQAFAGAIIIYFSLIGFLGTYLVTRLYLSQVFESIDVGGLGIDESLKYEFISSDLSDPTRVRLKVDAETAASRILDKSLDQLTNWGDIVSWSKAQFNAENYEKALDGYAKAVQMTPNDIQLRLEYTNALYHSGIELTDSARRRKLRGASEEQLKKAYDLIQTSPDPALKMRVYRAITFFYTYEPPPKGFEETIRYGKEYVNSNDSRKIQSGGIWVNLAAAYGQKYKWLKEQNADQKSLEDTRNLALNAARNAIAIDNSRWLNRLRELFRTDIQKKAIDNDLEVFEKDNEFRRLLELAEI
jgi:tetratricopeptide (TPR) repeat protein